MTADARQSLLDAFRPSDRATVEKKLLLAEKFGWTDFYIWHGERDAPAEDLMGVSPQGERKLVPELGESTK